MRKITALLCVTAAVLANVAANAEPARAAKVLVVLRTHEADQHIRPARGSGIGAPLFSDAQSMNSAYREALDFDRDSPLTAALTLAFRDRAPFVELVASADRARYMSGAPFDKPTEAARNEGFDFVLALYDTFVGFGPRSPLDDEAGRLTPMYGVSYGLFDLATNRAIQRGHVRNFGFKPASFDGTARDLALFPQTWPYLCLQNSSDLVDELIRKDAVHEMAAHIGRGDEYPAVEAAIEAYRKRLDWRLKPARGWVDRRSDTFERVMYPKGDLAKSVWMTVDVELLLAALGQQAKTVDEFVSLYYRDRARLMPDAPLERFTDIDAPGYGAWRYVEPGGEHALVFVRKSSAMTMQVMRLTIIGKFDEIYPPLRGKIEQMLANSRVDLN